MRRNKYGEEHKENAAFSPAKTCDGASRQAESEDRTNEIDNGE